MLSLTVRFCADADVYQSPAYYCEAAYKLVYQTPEHYTLARMQTYLLLAVYDCMHSDGNESRGWISLGNSIRIGQILHVAEPSNVIPVEALPAATYSSSHDIQANKAAILEARRRTFWSAFLLECLLVRF